MNLNFLTGGVKNTSGTSQKLKNQLMSMMLLRSILYTLLLGISLIFQGERFDVILLPYNLLFLLLLFVYLVTIASAFILPLFTDNLRKFGFSQNLLDTLFVTLLVFFSGSSSSIFTSVYFFPIIAGGLILPKKGGFVAAAAASLQYGFLLALEIYGLYPGYIHDYIFFTPRAPMVIVNHFSIHGLTFFLAAILSTVFGIRLRTTEDALKASIIKFDSLAGRYKQIFDNITTGILTIDDDQIIISANNAIETITGYIPETLTGQNLAFLSSDFNLSSPNIRQTTDFTRVDGQKVRIGYSHMIIQQTDEETPTKNSPQTIITLRDISDIEKLEKQVRQTEKLAAIGMMSASIAHDFRNPLAAISGSAQVMAKDFVSSDATDHTNYKLTKIILRESNRLIDTISDFLKFSRPEHVSSQWFSLRNCINEVLQVCRADPKWPQSCEVKITIAQTLAVWADEKLLFTVFIHLVQNGLAFCPKGEERLTISAHEIKTGDGEEEAVEISICDNGPGVPVDERDEHIFEPFFTSRPDGTGLGLAITKQTIDAHRGSISVGDYETGGAIFTITLPLPYQPE